ncbi:MAG: HAMP domain-containing histidine kinase [Xanthomonadales bacterium]|nr:HAMP domain-containing histidine kinase [Xanthomonadales bacterium]
MGKLRTRFSRKLHVAFGTLLMITLGLAWYFYDSVKWYEHDVQRIALANHVLQGYQNLSKLTFQELNDLGDRVFRGDVEAPEQARLRDAALRNAVSRVRQGITAEVAFDSSAAEGAELESLVNIERVVEEIIRSRSAIYEALAEGRQEDAQNELSRLRSAGVSGYFAALVENALSDQRREVRESEQDSIALARYITKVLPVIVLILVLITMGVLILFSRSLSRSVGALHDGVRAFTAGNLSHRIPELSEREFWRLGEAFNTMAREVSDHRSRLHDANVTLEAKIEERTRALQASNRKLADVDINRRKLLADISHEFRTPLTVIRGESEIALRAKSRNKEEYRESFQRIMDQADHTTRLVDDLLFIARVDAGEPRLDLRSVAISGTLEAVCEEFKARAQQKDITIEQRGTDVDCLVLGDAGRLRQVFAILLDNALRYSNAGGTVEVDLALDESEVRVRFRDHGIGLTPDEAEQAFERFFRGAQAEEHAPGTGLGLPVAKAIVEAHKGSISLEGEPGEGATAIVTLPAESRLRVVA